MTPDPVPDGRNPPRPRGRTPAQWPVWRLPARLLWTILIVEGIASALVVCELVARPLPTPEELRLVAVLWLLGILHAEVSIGVERERRRITLLNHVDLSSVWTFAAAVVLPGPYAALVAVVVLTHLWFRAWRPVVPLHRQVFSTATIVLSCIVTAGIVDYAGSGVDPAHHDLWVLLVALLAFATINTCLIGVVISVSTPRAHTSAILAPWDENLLELGLLCLGALTAVALTANPWLMAFVLLPVLAMVRTVLIRPLVDAASTDGKTGLLNAATWFAEADRILRRPGAVDRACGVLVLDLDHFKSVNDNYGHVVGDQVLAAIADVLRREVRAPDVVGRLGGEEFVVMPLAAAYGARSVELEVVAERVRARVADLRVEVLTADGARTVSGLSVSVGGAVSPATGADLASLLHTADVALYAAKRAGRNRVRIHAAPPEQPAPAGPTGVDEQSAAAE